MAARYQSKNPKLRPLRSSEEAPPDFHSTPLASIIPPRHSHIRSHGHVCWPVGVPTDRLSSAFETWTLLPPEQSAVHDRTRPLTLLLLPAQVQMVTTTNERAGTPSQLTQDTFDDFRSLLASLPLVKADALKERIYDWLERRERDATSAVEKAKARVVIVDEQNRIVRMELQEVQDDHFRDEGAAHSTAKAGLYAEAMSALNEPATPKEGEEVSEEESDEQDDMPVDYKQPTDNSATTHGLQPIGADIGRKMRAGDTNALDVFIKELLDEVKQLREGASANVATILTLEDKLQTANNDLETQRILLNETLIAQKDPYSVGVGASESWTLGREPSIPMSPTTFPYKTTPIPPLRSQTKEEGDESRKLFDAGPWLPIIPDYRNPDPTPVRGYLDEETNEDLSAFDACFKEYANMMVLLQLKGSNELVTHHEIPWPVLPSRPEDRYPVPRWKMRFAEKQEVNMFVRGFLASKHADMWRGSMRDDWLDLLECRHEDAVKEIVEKVVGFLD